MAAPAFVLVFFASLGLLRRRFAENPLFARHLTTTLTGPRLGSAVLLVNVTLLVTYVTLFIEFSQTGLPPSGGQSAGARLYFWHSVMLFFLLAFLLPLKVAGHLEGARLGGCFDQLVVTGASPLRFHAGSWMAGLVYTAVILLVSLPFSGCIAVFGGVPMSWLARSYLVLFAYGNVIILVTLAFSTFEREWVAVPVVIVVFWLLGIFGVVVEREWLSGYPLHAAELAPTRLFFRDARPYDLPQGFEGAIDGRPILFSTAVPLAFYRYASWTCAALVALLLMTIGPGHRFTPGLNNFGAAVLPGDRRRGFLRRLRPLLNRRIEVAFLYENRPRWCEGWDFPIRLALSAVPVVFLWGVVPGLVYGRRAVPLFQNIRFYRDEEVIVSFLLNAVILALWVLFWCDPKYRAGWLERVGRRRVPREALLLGVFGALCLGLFGVQRAKLEEQSAAYEKAFAAGLVTKTQWGRVQYDAGVRTGPPLPGVADTSGRGTAEGAEDGEATAGTVPPAAPRPRVDPALERYREEWWAFVPAVLLFLTSMFLLSRLLGRGLQGVFTVRTLTVAAGFITVLGPLMVLYLVAEGLIEPRLAWLGGLTPAILVDEIGEGISWSLERRRAAYFAWQGLFAVFLLLLLVFLQLRSPRRPGGARGARSTRAAGILGLGLALCGGGTPALARDAAARGPSVQLEKVVRGFEGTVFDSTVDFFTLVVRNSSAETVDGEVWLEAPYEGWSASRSVDFQVGPLTARVVRIPHPRKGPRYHPSIPLRVVVETAGARIESEELGLSVVESGSTSTANPSRGRVVVRVSSSGNARPSALPHAYLLVGDAPGLSAEWIRRGLGGNKGQAVSCKSLVLPEHAGAYQGVTAVFIGPEADLSRWSERQRRALYDWVRLGGTVVFHGTLDEAELAGAGIWQEILRSERSSTIACGEAFFEVEELVEGTGLVEAACPATGRTFPLLSARSVGAGHVGHLSFDPESAVFPQAGDPRNPFSDSGQVVSEIVGRLPVSRFPMLISPYGAHDRHLRDPSSLLIILGYFVAYTLIFGLGLIIFFRKRERRAYMWFAIPACSLLFLAAMPALNGLLHSRPSFGEYSEVFFLRAGSTRGVAIGHLQVRSSGRQEHDLLLAGRRPPRVYRLPNRYGRRYYSGFGGFGGPVEEPLLGVREELPLSGAADERLLGIETAPWGLRRAAVVGSRDVSRPPSGWAHYRKRSAILSFRIALPPELAAHRRPFVALFDAHEPGSVWMVDVPPSAARGEGYEGRVDVPPGDKRRRRNIWRRGRASFDLGWSDHSRPRAAIGWFLDGDEGHGVDLRSSDVRFERRVPEVFYKRMMRGYPAHIAERDGRYVQRLKNRLVLCELPLRISE